METIFAALLQIRTVYTESRDSVINPTLVAPTPLGIGNWTGAPLAPPTHTITVSLVGSGQIPS